jgi:DNA-directed RNA polymerase subunit K/omega
MVKRPVGFNPFEFSVLSGLRAAQLARGCVPLVEAGLKVTTTAQLEVAAFKIRRRVESEPAVTPT